MKKLFCTTVVFLLVLKLVAQPSNDWTKQGLKGKVKTQVLHSFKAVKGSDKPVKGERTSWSNSLKSYDEKGFLTETVHYKSDMSESGKTIHQYDESWRKTKVTSTDQNGKLKGEWVYTYDSNDNPIEIIHLGADGQKKSRTTIEYDDMGNKVIKRIYEYDKAINNQSIYQQFLTEQDIENQKRNGHLTKTEYYKWNEAGTHIVDCEVYEEGELRPTRWTSKYNSKGKEIEFNYFNRDGSLYSKTTKEYDKRGNIVVSEDVIRNSGVLKFPNLTTYQYKYDRKGNWIEKIEFKDGNPKYIREREIQYYK